MRDATGYTIYLADQCIARPETTSTTSTNCLYESQCDHRTTTSCEDFVIRERETHSALQRLPPGRVRYLLHHLTRGPAGVFTNLVKLELQLLRRRPKIPGRLDDSGTRLLRRRADWEDEIAGETKTGAREYSMCVIPPQDEGSR